MGSVGELTGSSRTVLVVRDTVGVALGSAGAVVSLLGRPFALFWPVLLAAGVALISLGRTHTTAHALLATLIGFAPAVVLVGATQDLLGLAPAPTVSAVALFTAWLVGALTLGAAVAERIAERTALFDAWVRIGAALAVTGYIAGALIRLLLPEYTTEDRLTWAIWEEDNAHVIGVAREVLTDGPRGRRLADQYGTAFVNLPIMLVRLFGGPAVSEPDPRLQAITVFTVSTVLIIVLAGIAMALIASLPHHVHRSATSRAIGPLSTALGAMTTAIATVVAFSLLVVLPMRTGFLTFLWGLSLVLLGAAYVLATPADAPASSRVVLVALLVGLLVLLLSSWPFIAPALAPLLLVPLVWVPWRRLLATLRRHAGRSLGGLAVALVALLAVGYWFANWGPAAEVISYGRDILVIEASGIFADATARRAAALAIVAAAVLTLLSARRGSRSIALLGLTGPVLGAGALYMGLRIAAELLTGGELNYSGIKLFYGVVTLAITLGLLGLASQSSRAGSLGALGALVLVVALHQSSVTASLHTEWWDRTLLGPHAHVAATVDAIRQTTPDVPIRCLPSPGTVITDTSRWAAFTCARWMEDAFNERRFHGHRFELLNARGDTFEPIVEEILATSPSEYLFAYRLTMGPGWFGWTGPNS